MKRVYYTYSLREYSGYMDFDVTASIEQINLKIGTNAIITKIEML